MNDSECISSIVDEKKNQWISILWMKCGSNHGQISSIMNEHCMFMNELFSFLNNEPNQMKVFYLYYL